MQSCTPDMCNAQTSSVDSSAMTVAAKRAVRDWAREVRAQEMQRRGPELNATIVAALRACTAYQRAGTVAAYLAFGDEVDLGELLVADDKRLVLPRTHRRPEPHLTLHHVTAAQLTDESALSRHAYGFLEPTQAAAAVEPDAVDLFLVPGLAFDITGVRLGYGLGYYDRLLPRARAGAVVVGVTLDALVLPDLPHGPHDARMNYLVTETGWREALRVSSQLG